MLNKKILNFGVDILAIIIVVLLSKHFYKGKDKRPYINENSYPVKASEWILDNLDINNMKLFNEYNTKKDKKLIGEVFDFKKVRAKGGPGGDGGKKPGSKRNTRLCHFKYFIFFYNIPNTI